MIFDAKRRVYIENGRALSSQEVRDHIESFVESEQKQVDSESKKVLLGLIPLAVFFSWLADKIRSLHSITGVVGYGGQEQMNLDRWKRINEKVQSELEFLDQWRIVAEKGFFRTQELARHAASIVEKDTRVPSGLESVVEREVQSAIIASNAAERDIAVREAVTSALADSIESKEAERVAAQVVSSVLESQSLDDLIWGSLQARGRSYVDASFSTYMNSVKARESDAGVLRGRRITEGDSHVCDGCELAATSDYVPLDELPDIGEQECGPNDRCDIEFEYTNVEPIDIDREIYA